jgi:hypothetical protein
MVEIFPTSSILCRRIERNVDALMQINVHKSRQLVELRVRLVTFTLPLQFWRYHSLHAHKIITKWTLVAWLPSYTNESLLFDGDNWVERTSARSVVWRYISKDGIGVKWVFLDTFLQEWQVCHGYINKPSRLKVLFIASVPNMLDDILRETKIWYLIQIQEKRDKRMCENYRGISMTNPFMKIMDIVIKKWTEKWNRLKNKVFH